MRDTYLHLWPILSAYAVVRQDISEVSVFMETWIEAEQGFIGSIVVFEKWFLLRILERQIINQWESFVHILTHQCSIAQGSPNK